MSRCTTARSVTRARGATLTAVALLAAACSSSGTGAPTSSSPSASSGGGSPAAASPSVASPSVASPSVASPSAASPSAAGPSTPASGGTAGLPASVRSSGVLKIGSDTTYPPMEFISADGSTPEGFDIDLLDKVAAKLGVKAQFQTANFDTILTSVASGRTDLGVSSLTITNERKKQVTFVSYLSVGTQWAAAAGNPAGITPDDACGHPVAVQSNTVQQTDLEARSKKCTAAGKAKITVLAETAGQQPFTDVASGKADAALSDLPTVAYAVKQLSGKLEQVGTSYATAPYGIALRKGQTAFAGAIASAINGLIADGTYATLSKKWDITNADLRKSQVDPTVAG